MNDHLARAKEYIARGEDFYRRAAAEILAEREENGTKWVTIADALGRSESWVHTLVREYRKLPDPTADLQGFSPFGGEQENEARYERQARTVLRDPERMTRAIRDLSDEEREQVVDTAIKVTAQEATAKAREHQTEPTLADTRPSIDRTEFEVDVLLVKVWRWARELRRLVETRGVWVAEDRFDEALQRAQEAESAVAEVRAAIEEAVNERSVA